MSKRKRLSPEPISKVPSLFKLCKQVVKKRIRESKEDNTQAILILASLKENGPLPEMPKKYKRQKTYSESVFSAMEAHSLRFRQYKEKHTFPITDSEIVNINDEQGIARGFFLQSDVEKDTINDWYPDNHAWSLQFIHYAKKGMEDATYRSQRKVETLYQRMM